MSAAYGGMEPPAPVSPYANWYGMKNLYFEPTDISCRPSVQPLMTPLSGNEIDSPRL